MPAALALLSSVLWGTADFLGGVLSRRMAALRVVLLSQASGLVVMAVLVLAGAGDPIGRYAAWGLLGGAVGSLAVVAFYRALAVGRMSVVAPVAATGVVLPVVVGLVRGEDPSLLQLVGIGLAVAGAVLASGPELLAGATERTSVLLAASAAVGFGTVLGLTAEGSKHDVIVTLFAMRAGAVLVVAPLALLAGRELPRIARADVPMVLAIGTADLLAIAAYGVATHGELLAVVSVLASLYPVMTVVLAWRVYGDRVRRVQGVGILAALLGVVLLAGS